MIEIRQKSAAVLAVLFSLAVVADENACYENKIELSLTEATWVDVKTAKVIVNVMAGAEPAKAGSLRRQILARLKQLVAETDSEKWRITQASIHRDPSGLERIRLKAEIRVPAEKLPGIYGRAEKLSTPGLQLAASIDWRPSLAEIEAARAAARQALYRRSALEAERIEQQIGVPYEIAAIRFLDQGATGNAAGGRFSFMAAEKASTAPPRRAERLAVHAEVVLRNLTCPAANQNRPQSK